ncbi:OmpA family protein [Noviherbaspirillum denitrificans]|uniref:Flagellar motor protein MotB n=1 Tax=Noviherbaspirillum denitrificans TaxID=1968433 RepID=A0A254T947_9BURK|nr:OmpA family protein [Noviherbaspirillum denitrificans]OWW19181.1 flagellar motor protein MotB [Noviherbaspirillum denitrificans]
MGVILAVIAFGAMIISQTMPRERVILLPNEDGTPSAVVVKTAQGETVIDTPYQVAGITGRGTVSARQEEAASVKERYGSTLAALPPKAASFTLYFETGTETLVPESMPLLARIKDELTQHAAPEIIVVGHTDRVGTVEFNDALSLRRAEAMRRVLVEAGIPAERIVTAGRGEREPLVKTADEVDEPKNRRVEIRVR